MKAFAVGWLVLGGTILQTQAQTVLPAPPTRQVQSSAERDTRAISRKLTDIVLPNVEFRQTTLNDAVEYLRQLSRQVDHDDASQNRGVNIIVQSPLVGGSTAEGSAQPSPVRVTLNLRSVPLSVVLQYVAGQAGLQVKVEPHTVILAPASYAIPVMKTAIFQVPPTFFGGRPSGSP